MRLAWALLRIALFVSIMPLARAGYFLACSPSHVYLGTEFIIDEGSGAHVKIQYSGVSNPYGATDYPNFIVVVPSSGTTPALVQTGLNPSVVAQMQPGATYTLDLGFTTVDQTPPVTAGCGPIFVSATRTPS